MAQTKARIAQHRQSDGVITVRGANGQPIPGAEVKIEQLRHEFLFGCNFFNFARLRDPQQEEGYRERFTGLLNFATLAFYWGMYERQQGRPDYDYTDKVVAWCRAQGLLCKGHPLVWDHAVSSPRWLPEDFAEIDRLSTGRVREIVSRFQGRIDLWDAVNEPTHLGQVNKNTRMAKWAGSLGAVPYVRKHLEVARAANPRATLVVNDYRTDPPFYGILDALRENGRLLYDVVGLQSHMHDGGWPLRKVWEVSDRYARLGLPLHFTEITIVSGPRTGPGENWGPTTPALEAKQAEYVARFYTTLFAHPAVQGAVWWDLSDQRAWQGAAAGLLREDMSPKPVYERLMALIKRDWWTKTGGQTDAGGEFKTRAFHGTHRVTATLPNGRALTKEIRWQRGQPNQFDLSAS